jgi:4-carboxymuconolactone decarboxylase
MSRVPLIDQAAAIGSVKTYFDETVAWLHDVPGPRGGGADVPKVYKALANSPYLVKLLSEHARYVITISPFLLTHARVRQFASITVSRRLSCEYSWRGQWPVSERAGITLSEYNALLDINSSKTNPIFNEQERSVIAFADSMTMSANVDDITFDSIQRNFGNEGIVEMTMLCGFYIMLCSSLNTLRIDGD